MITRRLSRAHPVPFSAYCITAAFCTYFCMYAFRKPFTAGTFEGVISWGVGYKTVLIVAQMVGYAASKFIGVKVISEMAPQRRAVSILVLIGAAHASLFCFGLIPPPWNFLCLFLNGLPLGMVFGLVLSYLEGRRLTEALTAGLCVSFIVSSGCVKSVGRYLILAHSISECWMPFLTGLIFMPPLVLSVWMLAQIPPPKKEDVRLRSHRAPMTARDRRQLFVAYAPGLCLLITTYVVLTVLRSVRDDFAVEIWRDLGEQGRPAVYTLSETVVMFAVVGVNGTVILIRDNRRAMLAALGTVIFGLVMVCVSIAGFTQNWLSPFPFMVLIGIGMYLPYVAFNTTVFERLIAVFRTKGNIGYLIYVADAAGYLGYVVVMLFRSVGDVQIDFLSFFLRASLGMSAVALVAMVVCVSYFQWKMSLSAAEPSRIAHARTLASND